MRVTVVCMATVDRFSITMAPELGEAVRAAAERGDVSVSAWLSSAASDRLRNDLLGTALDDWELEHGAFTEDELDRAATALGVDRGGRRQVDQGDRGDRGVA